MISRLGSSFLIVRNLVSSFQLFNSLKIRLFCCRSVLSAVSPAIVVPTLQSLKAKGYGEAKGISTLVIAASSIDDIISISAFGVILGMIFSKGTVL